MKDTKKLNKSSQVLDICREDLIEDIGKEKALKITDDEMKFITEKLSNALMENYWISLSVILDDLIHPDCKLNERKKNE